MLTAVDLCIENAGTAVSLTFKYYRKIYFAQFQEPHTYSRHPGCTQLPYVHVTSHSDTHTHTHTHTHMYTHTGTHTHMQHTHRHIHRHTHTHTHTRARKYTHTHTHTHTRKHTHTHTRARASVTKLTPSYKSTEGYTDTHCPVNQSAGITPARFVCLSAGSLQAMIIIYTAAR